MTKPIADLAALLSGLDPVLMPGVQVFARLPHGRDPNGLPLLASFRELEGWSIVLAEADAHAAGLEPDFRADWIALRVHSDLAAVGLTAAVASALAAAGIACNVIAAFHHDHLFVPVGQGEAALAALRDLQSEAR
jgi:hypothetical protein